MKNNYLWFIKKFILFLGLLLVCFSILRAQKFYTGEIGYGKRINELITYEYSPIKYTREFNNHAHVFSTTYVIYISDNPVYEIDIVHDKDSMQDSFTAYDLGDTGLFNGYVNFSIRHGFRSNPSYHVERKDEKLDWSYEFKAERLPVCLSPEMSTSVYYLRFLSTKHQNICIDDISIGYSVKDKKYVESPIIFSGNGSAVRNQAINAGWIRRSYFIELDKQYKHYIH